MLPVGAEEHLAATLRSAAVEAEDDSTPLVANTLSTLVAAPRRANEHGPRKAVPLSAIYAVEIRGAQPKAAET
eukprot:696806-Pyramimonas_sp.AAC.1